MNMYDSFSFFDLNSQSHHITSQRQHSTSTDLCVPKTGRKLIIEHERSLQEIQILWALVRIFRILSLEQEGLICFMLKWMSCQLRFWHSRVTSHYLKKSFFLFFFIFFYLLIHITNMIWLLIGSGYLNSGQIKLRTYCVNCKVNAFVHNLE